MDPPSGRARPHHGPISDRDPEPRGPGGATRTSPWPRSGRGKPPGKARPSFWRSSASRTRRRDETRAGRPLPPRARRLSADGGLRSGAPARPAAHRRTRLRRRPRVLPRRISNPHTRCACGRAVRDFLTWCEREGLELIRITPGLADQYFHALPGSRGPSPLGATPLFRRPWDPDHHRHPGQGPAATGRRLGPALPADRLV